MLCPDSPYTCYRLPLWLRSDRREQSSATQPPRNAVCQSAERKLRDRRRRFDHDSKRNVIKYRVHRCDGFAGDYFDQEFQHSGHGLPRDGNGGPERTCSNPVRTSTGRQPERDTVRDQQRDGRHHVGGTGGNRHSAGIVRFAFSSNIRKRVGGRERYRQCHADQCGKCSADDHSRKSFRAGV